MKMPAIGDPRPRPRMSLLALGGEALASVLGQPSRAALTILGTVVGGAALVATLGLSRTAGNQIVGRFDVLAATDIVVEPKLSGAGQATTPLPWDTEARLLRLNGVVAAGTLSEVDGQGQLIRAAPIHDPISRTEFQFPIRAVSGGLPQAVRATLSSGRSFDAGHSTRADRVVLLGRNVADALHISGVDDQPAIFIGDTVYVVLGILESVERQPALLSAVLIPEGTARKEFGLLRPGLAQAETRLGAAYAVAAEAPIALSPNDPALLKVTAPPEPQRVRAGVQADLDSLFLLLGLVSLVVGALGIANITLVSVMERIGEIGLRRALGATRVNIASQFLLESTLLGTVGGVVGASVGTLAVVLVASLRGWTPVLELWVPLAAPVAGAAVGLAAGLYPSIRAARLEPVEALRAGI